jgi:hypothetical protein
MDQATLVNLDVNAGLKVLEALDDAQIKVAVALWMITSDYDDWRLVLCLPSLNQNHLLQVYQKVADVARGRFVQMLPPILILPTKDPFIRELRRIFGKAKDVTGLRLGGQTIGDRYISDAYVYRIQ